MLHERLPVSAPFVEASLPPNASFIKTNELHRVRIRSVTIHINTRMRCFLLDACNRLEGWSSYSQVPFCLETTDDQQIFVRKWKRQVYLFVLFQLTPYSSSSPLCSLDIANTRWLQTYVHNSRSLVRNLVFWVHESQYGSRKARL